ncbi:MAG: ClpX C4-type zinc finger protein [Gemmataceae bacterium]
MQARDTAVRVLLELRNIATTQPATYNAGREACAALPPWLDGPQGFGHPKEIRSATKDSGLGTSFGLDEPIARKTPRQCRSQSQRLLIFCRKSYRDVGPEIEAPAAIYICGECIELY